MVTQRMLATSFWHCALTFSVYESDLVKFKKVRTIVLEFDPSSFVVSKSVCAHH